MGISYRPLKVLCAKKDIKMYDLHSEHQILGRTTIAKLNKGEYVSMQIIEKLCNFFEVTPNDIFEVTKD